MGYAAREKKAERRMLLLQAAIVSFMTGHPAERRFPRSRVWRTIRKPKRHVHKFHEPSFKGEPWFFRKQQRKEEA